MKLQQLLTLVIVHVPRVRTNTHAAEPLAFPFYWVHAPRTGSTFGGVLAAAVCNRFDQIKSIYHPHMPAAKQQINTSAPMFRHYFGSMVPVLNASVEELSTTSWRAKVLLCEPRARRFSSFQVPAKLEPFSLGKDDTFAGPQWSHGHNPFRGSLPIYIMIREPIARLVSAYKHGLPVMCDNQPAFKNDPCLNADALKLTVAASLNSPALLRTAASLSSDESCSKQLLAVKYKKQSMMWSLGHQAMNGCQTKMLLGRACSSTQILSREDIAKAVRLVRNRHSVVFAGDTDLWYA